MRIMTKNAIEYTVKQLFKIANPKDNVEYSISIEEDKNKVTLRFKDSKKTIVFYLANEYEWINLIQGKHKQLYSIDNLRGSSKIPVLFWRDQNSPFVSIDDNELIFNGDIISSAFFMLSRWEERYNQDFDIHGRFKYENSVAYKYNFITIPIVDEYAMLLRKELQKLFPNLDMGKRKFSIKLSHDIDDIRRFKNLKQAIRTLGGDLIKTKNIKVLCKSLLSYKNSCKSSKKDPYFLNIYELAKLSKENNMDSAFYFMTASPSNYDSGYYIDNHVKECISHLHELGFEVGFHPGYYTLNNLDLLAQEKKKLDKVLGYTNYGGRQHYLRFDIKTTWKNWEQIGLTYDSSLGYAEHEGFRCGTCHPFNPFDIDEDRELNIIEIPLVAMDATLQFYRNLTPREGLNAILSLIDKCKEVEGVFTLLWHNTSIDRVWGKWIAEVYKYVLCSN